MDLRWQELGAFLRSRRERLEPRFDLPGDHRRVPGQRREEVATAAGVSVSYYTRLEQGRAPNVSDSVLNAVCRALNADDADRAHVWRLARPAPAPTSAGSSELVRSEIIALLDQLPVPGLVLGRDRHLLAWNAAGHRLHAPHLARQVVDDAATRPWWPDLLFCDPQVAGLFPDWEDKARDTVADLRIELSRRPHGERLSRLIDGLRDRSAAFRRLWSGQLVTPCAFHDRRYRHADLGDVTFHDEFLELGDDNGQRLALFTAR